MIQLAHIYSERLNDAQRLNVTANLFGVHFPFNLEPTIYAMADRLAPAYNGGYWHFYGLSNQGLYMAPDSDTLFDVSCENGFDMTLIWPEKIRKKDIKKMKKLLTIRPKTDRIEK